MRGKRAPSSSRPGRRNGARQAAHPRGPRRLQLERFEERHLLAAPQVGEIRAFAGDTPFDLANSTAALLIAPRELTLRFQAGQQLDPASLGSIQLVRAGGDDTFGNANDVTLTNLYVALGDMASDVIVRFADTLPDDRYELRIANSGTAALRNTAGETLAGPNTFAFELDLAPQVAGVVPQPLTRNTAGALTQDRSRIDVYFNADPLNPAAATNPDLYQLIATQGTASPLDDLRFLPQTVTYDSATGRAQLEFTGPAATALATTGDFRLRIGNNDPLPIAPLVSAVGEAELGDSFATARAVDAPLGLGSPTRIFTSAIDPRPAPLPFPGSSDEPGHRDLPDALGEDHLQGGADTDGRIPLVGYYFPAQYGADRNGNPLTNQITPAQRDRVREVFELFSYYLGVQFVEGTAGISIIVGDPRQADPTVPVGPGGPSLGGGSGIIMNAAANWGLSEPLGGFFTVAMHEIGHALGFGHAYDLPALQFQGNEGETSLDLQDNNEPRLVETVLPGDHDLVHGRFLYRPDSTDLDLYRFELSAPGRLSLETLAERLPDASPLNTVLTLYREDHGQRTLIARNDDYFSSDAFIGLDVTPGTYFVAVSSTGNTQFDPTVPGTGAGGTTQGAYELRISLDATPELSLSDATGRLLDGDGDGVAGGEFHFFFRTATEENTWFVDKTAAPGGNGRLASPYPRIADALASAAARIAIPADVAGRIADGDTITLRDGFNLPLILEFNFAGGVRAGNVAVNLLAGDSPEMIAAKLAIAINARPGFLANATATGPNVSLTGATHIDLAGTPALLSVPRLVRIVGNGGEDNDLGTPEDAVAYEVGITPDFTPLADGESLGAPQGTTVMIEPGTVIRLAAANLDAGTYANGLDRRGGALQILGVPGQSVLLTSALDVSGSALARPGDWGGVVFYADSDREPAGAFLNYVNHADIRYAGGAVTVQGIEQRFGALYVEGARPTLTHNTITRSANAAITADSPSFEDSWIRDAGGSTAVRFQADYGRVGPAIYGNRFSEVSLAGLFVRTETPSIPGVTQEFELPSRFDDADIVHILGENLIISGTPGGLAVQGGRTVGRLDGRLAIDPGILVKLIGSRIEVEMGAQLLAEGTVGQPVILTSLADSRYGAGGVFRTNSELFTNPPRPGDWSGVYFAPASHGSLDHVRLEFAGGTSKVAGRLDQFNPLAIHQANVRVAHSEFRNHLSGQALTDRDGRGANGPAVVFVRGAQPILVANLLEDNPFSAAITINVNALNHTLLADPGRSTGAIERFVDSSGNRYSDNYGPLVRDNRLGNNAINGLVVRGAELTTQSIWDDTDIVHVLVDALAGVREDEVVATNHHVYSGLRLLSSPSESLVVKFSGDGAGLAASGKPSDIEDRIGGTVQILGTPGHQVVLTSLADDSVGAGRTPDGTAIQTDTDNGSLSGGGPPVGPEVPNGTSIDNDVLLDAVGKFGVTVADGGGSRSSGITAQGITQRFTNQDFIFDFTNLIDVGANGGAVSLASTTISQAATLTSDDVVVSRGSFAGQNGLINWQVESRMEDGSGRFQNTITFTSAQPLGTLRFINYLDEDILDFTDDVLYLTGTPGQADFRAFTLDGPQRVGFSQGGAYTPGPGLVNATYDGWTADEYPELDAMLLGAGTSYSVAGNIDLTSLPRFTDATLGTLYGPADVTTALAWSVDPQATSATITTFLEAVVEAPGGGASGDWRGVQLGRFSNDRNVAIVYESEPAALPSGDQNAVPNRAQSLGELAPNERAGGDNRRLGFEVHGAIGDLRPGDVDVYSFTGYGGTRVWFDVDATSPALDARLELIDAAGNIVAIVRDGVPALAASDNSFAETQAADLYSVNPADPGFFATLPGNPGQAATYFIRVRSMPANPTDLPRLDAGASRGNYTLQVRLRATDEFPGSTIRYADIRFATNAIEVLGQPGHSPLTGESGDRVQLDASGNVVGIVNDSPSTATDLGNLLASDRNALGVSGVLAAPTDVRWYKFTLDYHDLQVIAGLSDGEKTWSTLFDIDYADGLQRPDTVLSVYAELPNGSLQPILLGRDSDILDDRSAADLADLSGGSFGSLDPYIGSVQLPASVNQTTVTNGSPRTYYVAVHSNFIMPPQFEVYFNGNTTDRLLRLEPVDGTRRLVEDHIGFIGYTSGDSVLGTLPVEPLEGPLLDISTDISLSTHVKPFELADLPLYVSATSSVWVSHVGAGRFLLHDPSDNSLRDLAMRSDGSLFAYEALAATENTAGRLVSVNVTDGTLTPRGNDGIPDDADTEIPDDPNTLTTDSVDALAFRRRGFDGTAQYDLVYSVRAPGGSRLFVADANSGSAAFSEDPYRGSAGSLIPVEPGAIVTGLAFVGDTLYAATSAGGIWEVQYGPGSILAFPLGSLPGVSFTGLAPGPRNLYDGILADNVFAIDGSGRLYAFDLSDAAFRTDLFGGQLFATTGVAGATGLAFSPIDFNLWHPTFQSRFDAGHGVNPAPNESREEPNRMRRVVFGGTSGQVTVEGAGSQEFFGRTSDGGASFVFNLEEWVDDPNVAGSERYLTYGANAQYGILSSDLHRDLTAATGVGDNYNVPGGAWGSLITNSFDLSRYAPGDKPTLYYNYALDTEGAESAFELAGNMRDSARVYLGFLGATGQQRWQPISTNNSFQTNPFLNGELPLFKSFSTNVLNRDQDPYRPGESRQIVQELFDSADPTWRQARIDLSDFAGQSNLTLRFDFSTAGSVNEFSLAGDILGDYFDKSRGANNSFRGFRIDDITIGFAERGEMITGTPATGSSTSGFFVVPQYPLPGEKEVLQGAYQLEIRRGTEYAANVSGQATPIALDTQFDTNDRLSQGSSMSLPDPERILPGEGFRITHLDVLAEFEYTTGGPVTEGRVPVTYNVDDTAPQLAANVAAAISARLGPEARAAARPGTNLVELFNVDRLERIAGRSPVDIPALPPSNALVEYLTDATGYEFNPLTPARQIDGPGYTILQYDLTSQNWLTPADSNRPEWHHWLNFLVPDVVVGDTAFLLIDGGNNSATPPDLTSEPEFPELLNTVLASQSIAVVLLQAPNQSTTLTNDALGRSNLTEDQLLASTFDRYLRTGNDDFPALLPMVQSAMAAMDAAETLTRTNTAPLIGNVSDIRDFVVSGFSKRGWTTYLTAAADTLLGRDRVKAIIPGVFDGLNFRESVPHHGQFYADVLERTVADPTLPALRFAETLTPYVDYGVFNPLRFPGNGSDLGVEDILAIVDPYNYLDALEQKKLVLVSTGDEFFVPGSTEFYFHDLQGDVAGDQHNYLRYVPNTGHGLDATGFNRVPALEGLQAFFEAQVRDEALPQYTWSISAAGEITVEAQAFEGLAPTVRIWQATNASGNDFRWFEGAGPRWFDNLLAPDGVDYHDGTAHYVYRAQRAAPPTGATAYMIELTYDRLDQPTHVFTSGVIVKSADPLSPEFAIFERRGDENRFRDQGQIIIENNRITSAAEFGIVLAAADRTSDGGVPYPGTARNLSELNPLRLVPGVTVENNLLVGGGTGGIHIAGDFPDPGEFAAFDDPLSATLFARVTNNTIYGGASPQGIGISVTGGASPTLLNNIVSGTTLGISVANDPYARTTVLAASIYQNNGADTNNVVSDSFSVSLPGNVPLFVDAAAGDFTPAFGSRAIDASINALEDRTALVNVTSVLGIPPSPILAPNRDLFARLRVDDPAVANFPGIGANVFKDRGAVERTTFLAPLVSIADTQVTVGTTGTALATFAVTLSAPLAQDATVDWSTADGTAIAPTDYEAASGTLFFPAGMVTPLVPPTVVVRGGTNVEGKMFFVNLSNPMGLTLSDSQGKATLRAAQTGQVSVSVNDVTVNRSDTLAPPAVFTVTLTGTPTAAVDIPYSTADGSGVDGVDYTATSGVLRFDPAAPNFSLTQTVTVPVLPADFGTPERTFRLFLGTPTPPGIVTLGRGQGTATVRTALSGPGGPVGDPIEVASPATGVQHRSDVAVAPNGSFVVVYASGAAGSEDVYLRRYSATGQPLAGPQLVNATFTSGNQTSPRIAMDGAGNMVVAWSGAGTGDDEGIFAQRFSPSGTPLGDVIGVNDATAGLQDQPDVAVDAGGDFVVSWVSQVSQPPPQRNVFVQRFSAAGTRLARFSVSSHELQSQPAPSVASDASGNFVVVFGTITNDREEIHGQLFGPTSDVGGNFLINDQTAETPQRTPAVATDALGNFVVSWSALDADGTSSQIATRRFPRVGIPGDVTMVSGGGTALRMTPAVSMDGFGNYVITWVTNGDGSVGSDIHGRLFDPAGADLSNGEFLVNQVTPGDQHEPAVAISPGGSGALVASWTGPDASATGVFAQRFLFDLSSSEAPQVNLGFVARTELHDLDPSSGELWFRVTPSQSGLLTGEALYSTGQAALALFDLRGTQVAQGYPSAGGLRFDHSANPTETYLLRLQGNASKVNLRLTNLVERNGSQVTVRGTADNDAFSFTAAETWRVSVNGVEYAFDPAEVNAITLATGGGSDTATLAAGDGAVTASLAPAQSTVTGPGYALSLDAFATVTVAAGNGFAQATLNDSTGDDQLVAAPTYAQLSGPGFFRMVRGFDTVRAFSTSPGDTATLYDSTGNDQLVAAPTYAQLSGSGFFNYAARFATVRAQASSGQDAATLYDSAGNDQLTAAAGNVQLSGAGFSVAARGFDSTRALASGGRDTAALYDSSGDDQFTLQDDQAQMAAAGFAHQAKGFEEVRAYATAGRDSATLSTQTGGANLVARPDYVLLAAGGNLSAASSFDVVRAFGSGPGDTATFYGSASGGHFDAAATSSQYVVDGRVQAAYGFETVRAYAADGSATRALLHDTALDDHLVAEADFAGLSNGQIAFALYRFQQVTAEAGTGRNTKSVQAVDFLLTTLGNWLDES